jgi:CPA1 family monovalent cation:H+ antiporter
MASPSWESSQGALGSNWRDEIMTAFQTIALVLVFSALANYLNHRFIKLPATMGLMVVGIVFSAVFIVLGKLQIIDTRYATEFVAAFDFSGVLLHGMLAFLLFAGALHVDISDLKSQKGPVIVLSTLGVLFSTFIIGGLFWYAAGLLGIEISFIYALVFGALISPTDPIAVMGLLKKANAAKSLEIKIVGESLFNDGVGVVIFLTIMGIAVGGAQPTLPGVMTFLLLEAGGGAILGLAMGYVVFLLLRSVDNYQVEVMLTLALAAGGYSLAEGLHVSAPIAIVVAGLLIGNQGREFAMSDRTRTHLDTFWELVDEMMNAVLFVLIGLEMIALSFQWAYVALSILSIFIVLLARFVSVGLPVMTMSRFRRFSKGATAILSWGGLRGGISIALALSLPPSPERDLILFVTYIVVIWSILVQGLTLGRVIQRVTR